MSHIGMSYFPLAFGKPMGELITHVNFGEWLKAMRQQRGFSLRALAEAAGVSHVSVDKAERGGGVRDSTLELLVGALAGSEASLEEVQELLLEARRVRAGLPEMERIPEETLLEHIELYTGDNPVLVSAREFQKALAAARVAGPVGGEEMPSVVRNGRGAKKRVQDVDK
jgi:transcriptional regulator with XRE-family HTH domain